MRKDPKKHWWQNQELTTSNLFVINEAPSKLKSSPDEAVLVHLDDFNEILCGVLAGYLVHSGMVPSGPVAVALVERITSRPLGPEGRQIAFSAKRPAGA